MEHRPRAAARVEQPARSDGRRRRRDRDGERREVVRGGGAEREGAARPRVGGGRGAEWPPGAEVPEPARPHEVQLGGGIAVDERRRRPAQPLRHRAQQVARAHLHLGGRGGVRLEVEPPRPQRGGRRRLGEAVEQAGQRGGPRQRLQQRRNARRRRVEIARQPPEPRCERERARRRQLQVECVERAEAGRGREDGELDHSPGAPSWNGRPAELLASVKPTAGNRLIGRCGSWCSPCRARHRAEHDTCSLPWLSPFSRRRAA